MISLIKLSENDKRALIALLSIFVFVFLLFGLLCSLIRSIMRKQGQKVDEYLYPLQEAGLLDTPRKLTRIARKKNSILYFLQSRIPLCIFFASLLLYLIFSLCTKDWNFASIFQSEDGFGSLFYHWDWSQAEPTSILGLTIPFLPKEFPPVTNTPHFINTPHAIYSYIFVPLFLVGGIWYLITTQAAIARACRIHVLKKQLFRKDLLKDK